MRSNASLAELPTLDEIREEKARRSLDDFTRRMLDLEPATHHRFVNRKLEAVARGENRRLMLFEPPGHAKSTYASLLFPAQYRGLNPSKNIVLATHTGDFSKRFGRRVRNLLNARDWTFPNVVLTKDTRAADEWEVKLLDEDGEAGLGELFLGGEYYAVGVTGAVTGRRADLVIIDDPIRSHKEAASVTARNDLWEWYRSDLRTRLKPGAAIILIQTRWHHDDLAGRILPEDYDFRSGLVTARDGEVWDVVSLPALAEENDPLGRAPGEALWPEWIDREMLEQERISQGPRNWAALYQQRPTPEEGDFFQRDWLRWYDKAPARDTLVIYGASDYAVTDGDGDFTVHGIVGVDPNDDIYVLDWWRAQTASDIWIEQLLNLMSRWHTREWGEEAGQIRRSLGPFIVKRMREAKVYCHRQQYPSSADKPIRAQGIRGRMAMGKVYFPRNAPWVEALIAELLTFPSGVTDDQVDVLSLFGRMLDRMSKGKEPGPPKPDPFDGGAETMDELMKRAERHREAF